MNPTVATAPRYEVEADFLQLEDPRGHRHFLRRGRELPDWVPADQVLQLLESGAIFRYEVI